MGGLPGTPKHLFHHGESKVGEYRKHEGSVWTRRYTIRRSGSFPLVPRLARVSCVGTLFPSVNQVLAVFKAI